MKITNNENKMAMTMLPQAGKLMLITGLSLMLTVSAFAQTSPDVVDGDPDSGVPFDGGISLLAAAGVAYGIKRWHDDRKDNTVKKLDSEV